MQACGCQSLIPSKDSKTESHYGEHDDKPTKLANFLTSGPVLSFVSECKGVIGYERTMIGA